MVKPVEVRKKAVTKSERIRSRYKGRKSDADRVVWASLFITRLSSLVTDLGGQFVLERPMKDYRRLNGRPMFGGQESAEMESEKQRAIGILNHYDEWDLVEICQPEFAFAGDEE